MDNSEHIHRLSLKAGIWNILLGSFLLLFVFGFIIVTAQDLLSGKSSFSNYLVIALMVFLLAPSGLLIMTFPFIARIVVKAQGIEYHNATYILSAQWKDLVNIGYDENTTAGKTLVVIPQGGELRIRSWATPFQEILVKKPQDIYILVSQFGTANGHSFETDILVNVSQQGLLSDELEAL